MTWLTAEDLQTRRDDVRETFCVGRDAVHLDADRCLHQDHGRVQPAPAPAPAPPGPRPGPPGRAPPGPPGPPGPRLGPPGRAPPGPPGPLGRAPPGPGRRPGPGRAPPGPGRRPGRAGLGLLEPGGGGIRRPPGGGGIWRPLGPTAGRCGGSPGGGVLVTGGAVRPTGAVGADDVGRVTLPGTGRPLEITRLS